MILLILNKRKAFYMNTNNTINTNNESGISYVQSSSFIKTPNGSLKRRKQKMFYKDIYLEKHNYVDTISERNQMEIPKEKVRKIKIIGQNNNKISFISNDDSINRKSMTSRKETAKTSMKSLNDVIPKISAISSSKTLQYESIQHLKNIRKELDEVINIEMKKYNKRNNNNDILCRSQTLPTKYRSNMRNSVTGEERRAVFIDSEEDEKENMKVCMSERNVMDNLHNKKDSNNESSKCLIEEVCDSNISDSVCEKEMNERVLKSKRQIKKKRKDDNKKDNNDIDNKRYEGTKVISSNETKQHKEEDNNSKIIQQENNNIHKDNNQIPSKESEIKIEDEAINLNIDLNDNITDNNLNKLIEEEHSNTFRNKLSAKHRNIKSFLSPSSQTYNKTLTLDTQTTTSPMTFRKKHTFFSNDINYSNNEDPKVFLSSLLSQKKQTRNNSHYHFSSMNTSNTPSQIKSSTFNIKDLITSQHNQLLKELNQSTQRNYSNHRSHNKYNPLPLYNSSLLSKQTRLTITDLFIEKLKQQGLYGIKTEKDDAIKEEDSFYKIKSVKVKKERKPKDYYINKVKQDMKEYYYKKLIGNNI